MLRLVKNVVKKVGVKRIVWGLIILVVGFAIYKIATRDGIKTLPVKYISTEKRQIKKTISASGEVKSIREADLAFNATGRLRMLSVSKGDVVTNGQFLAQLDSYSVSQTAQAYKDTRDIAMRNRDLFVEQYKDDKDAAGGEEEYNIQIRTHRENISKAEANYQANVANVGNAAIYAPFGGTVIDAEGETGEVIAIGTMVVKLADTDNLMFEVVLDQEDYGFVKQGQGVNIELDAYEREIFSGVVSKLPLYANGGSSPNFTVEISISSSENFSPLLGMTGDARIIIETTEDEVDSLTYDEVYYDEEDKPYVWILDGKFIEKYYVEIGLEGDIYTEIKSQIDLPLIAGVNNDVDLEDGFKAKVAKEK
jgi:RND family efflux transporter MFP subunit